VEKLRASSYLTTTKYTIKLAARSDTPGNWFAFGLNWKKMLLVAMGTVEAGIHLNQLDTSAVSVSGDGKSITVNLPPTMIRNRDYSLSNDPSEPYVYTSSGGWFANTSLETRSIVLGFEVPPSGCRSSPALGMGRGTLPTRRAHRQGAFFVCGSR
jgi:hypothetical protein